MSRGAGNYIRFTSEQAELIAQHLVDGTPVPEIARILGMPYSRVRDKVRALVWASLDKPIQKRSSAKRFKTPVSTRSIRDCLSCHRDFVSDGPHNRICDRCKSCGHGEAARFVTAHSVGRL